MKKKMTVDGKNFVKLIYQNKKTKEKIIEAVSTGKLNAYIMHPLTNKPIKIPVDLINKIKRGEKVTLDDIENYKYMN